MLKKVSISVVCSRWEEPFGRASLEACSRGSATIISNKGGLPETTKHPVIIKNLNVKELIGKINYLIKNKKERIKVQKKNYLNFIYDHKYITKKIDYYCFSFSDFKQSGDKKYEDVPYLCKKFKIKKNLINPIYLS